MTTRNIYIYDIVEKTIDNAEYHSLSNDIKLYVNEVNVEIYGLKMPFYYLCYNCRNEETCQNTHEYLDSKSELPLHKVRGFLFQR